MLICEGCLGKAKDTLEGSQSQRYVETKGSVCIRRMKDVLEGKLVS